LAACLSMTCTAGSYAALVANGAKTNTEGCTECSQGTWSAGGALTSCSNMTCAAGSYAAATVGGALMLLKTVPRVQLVHGQPEVLL